MVDLMYGSLWYKELLLQRDAYRRRIGRRDRDDDHRRAGGSESKYHRVVDRRRRATMRDSTRIASARSSSLTTTTMTIVALAIVASFCLVNVTLMARLVEDGRSHRHDDYANDGGVTDVPTNTTARRRRRVAQGRNDTTHDEDDEDEDPVLTHFRRAGVDLDDISRSRLPSWSYVESQYGKDVVIIGLDRCEYFRNNVPPLRRMLGSAGMFNSGTNLVSFWIVWGRGGGDKGLQSNF
jgi:hypothetical protein